ncbi:MAG: hypothetical protein HYY93_16385 [Planctomycetes bacterium]|nr:hypothetical protein [Planctomycetota bacterium]
MMHRAWLLAFAAWIALTVVTVGAQEEKPADKETPPGEPPAAAPPAAPLPPKFVFRDGSSIVGTVLENSIQVTTAYGRLTIPVGEISRVVFGLGSDSDLASKIAALIKDLGHTDFDTRERALGELVKIGPAAGTALRTAQKSGDAEVRSRSERALREIDKASDGETEEPIDDDRVITTRFEIRGTVELASLTITTRFGPLTAAKKDIASIEFPKAGAQSYTLQVKEEHAVGQELLYTKIPLRRGDRLAIRAEGSITFPSYGTTFTPNGNAQYGQENNLPLGCLVGRIGANGKIIKLGAKATLTADRDGVFYLGYVGGRRSGGEDNSGSYKVTVQVNEE